MGGSPGGRSGNPAGRRVGCRDRLMQFTIAGCRSRFRVLSGGKIGGLHSQGPTKEESNDHR